MKRRTFLLAGLGTGGALFLGWSFLPPRQRLRGSHLPDTVAGEVPLNGWLTIGPGEAITVVVPKAEIGQGIHTALAMLMAEELDVPLERVRVVHSPVDRIYANVAAMVDGLPLNPDDYGTRTGRAIRWLTAKTMREIGVMMTGGSSSIADCWEPMRQAGATARAALLAAGAAKAGVPVAQCRTEGGVVVAGAQRFPYGALAAAAAAERPREVRLKAPGEFRVIGRATPRLEQRAKVTGAVTYGIDVRLPGMKFAAVAMPPVVGSAVARFNREGALARQGVRAVVQLSGSKAGDPPGVAVVADSWWQARQALAALAVEWTPPTTPVPDSPAISATLRTAATAQRGLPLRTYGDAEEVVAASARRVEATYESAYVAHSAMEPMNATVRCSAYTAEIWIGTQVPQFVRDVVAEVAGVDTDAVVVHQHLAGGGFGRRLEADLAAQATAIAKAVPGTAVQLVWSREDDTRHDFYRPATASHLRAGLGADGTVAALTAHSAGQAPWRAISARGLLWLTATGPDKTTSEGTWDQPYEFPALRSAHTDVDLPVPVGSWRGVGHGHQAFFFESFLDECAHAAGQDPVAFRLALLRRHPRARAVLQRAAEAAEWGKPVAPAPDGAPVARGVALHWSFGTLVAQVAEVSLGANRAPRVHRVTCAIDCGLVVNPNHVAAQAESAIIDGIGAALHGAVTFKGGQAEQANFPQLHPIRLAEAPTVAVLLMPSAEAPSGVGEPMLAPVAPAIANALFTLTGQRLRALPLRLA
ncbi:MAG: molybdopterin-dependent oxidoreductase [Gemmatimonadetes bacterium]|nr:molybdopterin-dependent oxidoreductase [Gemmatimonadota bacterium]